MLKELLCLVVSSKSDMTVDLLNDYWDKWTDNIKNWLKLVLTILQGGA